MEDQYEFLGYLILLKIKGREEDKINIKYWILGFA